MKFEHIREHQTRLHGGSKSFYAASLVLPARLRDPATVLYAYCRVADDAIDQSDHPLQALSMLRSRLDRIYAGNPVDDPIDQDFARLVAHFAIPRALPEALLEGFLWDVQGRTYETIEELSAYAARVAGSVGVMMTLLMGVRDPATLARAADLGVAMQLTNIARDVAEDARTGRLYLPMAWMREAGVDPQHWQSQPAPDNRINEVIRRLLRRADESYRLADLGVSGLPRNCRFGIHAARRLYCAIGRSVLRQDADPFRGRATVAPAHKFRLLIHALVLAVFDSSPVDQSAPLSTTRFLIDSVEPMVLPAERSLFSRWRASFLAVHNLFERLEREERALRGQIG